MDLDFSPGLDLKKLISSRFSSSVSSSSTSSSEFFLVASFGRSAIRLNEQSMVLILQSCLRGKDVDFHVIHLSSMMFRFSVASKNVGFLIYRVKSYVCASFAVFFSLWGSGGPDWKKNLDLWVREQEDEWTVYRSKSSRRSSFKSYADVVKNSVHHDQSVFHRLHFPDNYVMNFVDELPSFSRPSTLFQNSNPLPKRPPSSLRTRRCFRCLSPDHLVALCKYFVCCHVCLGFGHVAKFCRGKKGNPKVYRPKSGPSTDSHNSRSFSPILSPTPGAVNPSPPLKPSLSIPLYTSSSPLGINSTLIVDLDDDHGDLPR